MRGFKRLNRGFTLVELMIVVAIIGILAALAIYGVRRYLASAKTSEAKNTIGAITRSAVAAYERETTSNEILADGATSAASMNQLCTSAAAAPAAVPQNTKIQPSTADGADFNTPAAASDNGTSGWKCLRFTMTQPVYYQYGYGNGAKATGMLGTYAYGDAGATGATSFEAAAVGDLDGNSVYSEFVRAGTIRNGQVVLSTEIFVKNEFE